MKSYSSNLPLLKKRYLQLSLIIFGLILISSIYLLSPELTVNILTILTVVWMMVIVGFLWLGNSAINRILNKIFPWLTFGTTRFFAELLLILIYSLIVINGSYYLFKSMFTEDPPVLDQLIVMNIYGGVLIVIVTSVYFGISFLRSWRKSELEAERMQKEQVKTQLKALQNHLDPHFLFNNLNILSSLIDRDKEQSKVFLEHFAEVYRGLLKKDLNDIIPLSQELEFLETYIYLIKIRFEENIQISINIDSKFKDYYLPPLALQMLLENTIKHNKITETKPLKVDVFIDEGTRKLVIKNSLQKKTGQVDKGSGLENVTQRYSYFTDEAVEVIENSDEFIVKIPLLEIDRT